MFDDWMERYEYIIQLAKAFRWSKMNSKPIVM
jgi:hypothetical protein